jgi:hypothetical protein
MSRVLFGLEEHTRQLVDRALCELDRELGKPRCIFGRQSRRDEGGRFKSLRTSPTATTATRLVGSTPLLTMSSANLISRSPCCAARLSAVCCCPAPSAASRGFDASRRRSEIGMSTTSGTSACHHYAIPPGGPRPLNLDARSAWHPVAGFPRRLRLLGSSRPRHPGIVRCSSLKSSWPCQLAFAAPGCSLTAPDSH